MKEVFREEIFEADMSLLGHNLLKVLEVDLREGLYYEVKVDGDELPKGENAILSEWIMDFAKENVHPDDFGRFYKFFADLGHVERDLKEKWMSRGFYRRKSKDGWRYVSAEFIKLEDFEDDGYALLVIRDIEDYIKDFKRQVGSYDNENI